MSSRPPVLLFLPGITPIDSNNAVRVAEVIAASQSRQHPGTYSVKIESPDAGHRGASILGPDGESVLQVVEVDYRSRLAETPLAKAADGWALLRSGRFALLGILRLIAAGRGPKTSRHRWFLLLGFAAVLMLIGAFIALAITAIAATGAFGWEVDWPEDDRKNVLLGAGLATSGGALYWIRTKLLDGSKQIRELVRYLERGREAASVALELDAQIDRLLDETTPPPAIHVLAYSFGSIVTLDALFSRIPIRPSGHRAAVAITSVVTVGSPIDFVRQFYPAYFTARTVRRPDLRWINLFLPEDILGSNLLDNDDHSGFETPPRKGVFEIENVRCGRSIAVGAERSSLRSLLSLEGFRVHGEYWDEAHRANLLEPVIDLWIVPSSTDATKERDVG